MHHYRFPQPRSWDALEEIVWGLFEKLLAGAQRHGRQGQQQRGVDIYGRRQDGSWIGIQVKNKGPGQVLTEPELRGEVEKAQGFTPPLAEFIVVTSAPDDAAIQAVARALTDENRANGIFSVDIWGWDALLSRLAGHADLERRYFSMFADPSEERERPRFDVVTGGDGTSLRRLEHAFQPSWRLRQLSGEPVATIEWRFRGPRFQMQWWQAQVANFTRMLITDVFDLRGHPVADDRVAIDELGVEVRYFWRGKWRHLLRRWRIAREELPHKVLWNVNDQVIPELEWDE
jgi:hypothetical protein